MSDYDELMSSLARYGTECYEVDRPAAAVKTWRTKLGGQWFMTWEQMGVFSSEQEFEAEAWWVFQIDSSEHDRLRLNWINQDADAWDVFDDVEDDDITRRAVERVIRRHADDEDFYETDVLFDFQRVKPEHYDLLEDFLDEGLLADN